MTIKMLNLGWQATLLRYFLMMACVIGGVLSGFWIIALLGLPLFLSAILGIHIELNDVKAKSAKVRGLKQLATEKKKAS